MEMMLIFPSHSGNQNILCDLITLYCAGGCNEKKVESLKKWSNVDLCNLGSCTVIYRNHAILKFQLGKIFCAFSLKNILCRRMQQEQNCSDLWKRQGIIYLTNEKD